MKPKVTFFLNQIVMKSALAVTRCITDRVNLIIKVGETKIFTN